MRVVMAPDGFGGTLSAAAAATAMAAGWRSVRPGDEVVVLPMSDGGPGFLDSLPGTAVTITVEDPLARPVSARFLLDGTTAYVESALACGLDLVDASERDVGASTTYGVGQLVREAVAAGASTVVVGLGGSATNDGGSGFLAALGGRWENAAGERLRPGGLALIDAARLVGKPVLAGVELVAATDVDAPLLGAYGASAVYGPQKGATGVDVAALDSALGHWADLLERHLSVAARDLPGAGAAGGLGFAILALGGTRVAGVDVVAQAVGLADAIAGADLVLTGEGSFDGQSLRGKVVAGVARAALAQALPCLVLAGRVSVGRHEAAAAGVVASHSLVEACGSKRALTDPADALAELAAGVAREWGV